MTAEIRRRSLIVGSLALGATCGVRAADPYPTRPIELVVPYGPGGASDVIARTLAEPLQQSLGQSVVVINRAGGNTAIAGAQLARSRNDGYQLMLADVALLLNAAIRTTSPGYNPEQDFQPVSMVGSGPMVLLVPASGARTLAEFLARGKDKGLTIGSSGQGSLGHLAGELLGQKSGVRITHVAYRGSGPAMNETMAGHVDATFGSTASGMPLVASGRLRALAVASPVRSRTSLRFPPSTSCASAASTCRTGGASSDPPAWSLPSSSASVPACDRHWRSRRRGSASRLWASKHPRSRPASSPR